MIPLALPVMNAIRKKYWGLLQAGVYVGGIGSLLVLLACAPEPPPPPEPPPAEPEVVRLAPHAAARAGDMEALRAHVAGGGELEVRDEHGSTLLLEAVSADQYAVVEWLIEQGADIHAQDDVGWDPVHLAAFLERQELVDLFLAHGAVLTEEAEEEEIAWEEVELEPEPEPEVVLPEGWAEMEFRTWTSASGAQVEAAFLELSQDMVTLGTPDGRVPRFPITNLSRDDQIEVRRLAGSAAPTVSRPGARSGADPGLVRVTSGFSSDCERILLRAIQQARNEIQVAIYTITRPQIGEALARAAQRGVDVQVKFDAKQLPVSRMQEVIKHLEGQGVAVIPVHMSGRYASMHHKFAVFDGMTVFTGSFNFTPTAINQSYENCVLIESAQVARDFSREFDRVRGR
jgi:hypothetical protein